MIDGSVVFYKIATTFLVILVGFISCRLKVLPAASITYLSRYALDIATPCLILVKMPYTINRETLSANWYIPVIGILMVVVSDFTGHVAAKHLASPNLYPTFRLLVAFPNWMFLSMAICEPIFGSEALRIILLCNPAVTIYLWTIGVSALQKGENKSPLLTMLKNTQFIVTLAAIALSLLFPFLPGMEKVTTQELMKMSLPMALTATLWEAMAMIAATAIPVSMLIIGIRLGTTHTTQLTTNRWVLAKVVLLRLIGAPIVTIAILWLIQWAGFGFGRQEFIIFGLIAAMPAAVALMSIAEVYKGEVVLTAKAIFWSTLLSLATVPVMYLILHWLGPKH